MDPLQILLELKVLRTNINPAFNVQYSSDDLDELAMGLLTFIEVDLARAPIKQLEGEIAGIAPDIQQAFAFHIHMLADELQALLFVMLKSSLCLDIQFRLEAGRQFLVLRMLSGLLVKGCQFGGRIESRGLGHSDKPLYRFE